jgi:long-chain acyl-CoA synthetase
MQATKPWLRHYPAHVPATITTSGYASLVQLWDESVARHGARPALTRGTASVSYAELDTQSRHFAAWLQSQGVTKGDRVALMLPNVVPFVVAGLGALRAGATVVAVNPLYTPRELAHQINDSGAKVLVVFGVFGDTVAAALPHMALAHTVVVGPTASTTIFPGQTDFDAVQRAGAACTLQPVALRRSDLALLQYTGGTTGVSKGAMLSHDNILANILQIELWLSPVLPPEQAVGKAIACFLPLYHIFALTVCMFYGLRNGFNIHLVANPRDLPAAIEELGGRPIHLLPGVNTLFAGLAQNQALLDGLNLTELKVVLGGGSAVQQGVAERWLAATGVPICEGYGLSETAPCVSCNLPTNTQWSGTIGLPLPSTDFAIRDDAGQDVPIGQRGEICLRGPQVMSGYWQRPLETAQAMTPDGYFKTGDIGTMDTEGFVRIVDRKKDMILVSGFNVFPNEVEGVVSTLPGVLESAAIGVPDERSGEAVKLFVVKSDPALSLEQVQAHCRAHLAAYKNPRHIEFLPTLPKSTVGKVLRRELRA